MNRLIYLKEAPKDEIEAMIIYHKRMGRDALWDILEVLNDAEGFMTKEEISQKINRKNIGTDLKFLRRTGWRWTPPADRSPRRDLRPMPAGGKALRRRRWSAWPERT